MLSIVVCVSDALAQPSKATASNPLNSFLSEAFQEYSYRRGYTPVPFGDSIEW